MFIKRINRSSQTERDNKYCWDLYPDIQKIKPFRETSLKNSRQVGLGRLMECEKK
jgi:hypothetical protein